MKVVSFVWDNQVGEEVNGRSLVIGQYLPKKMNENFTHVELYGVSLDIINEDLKLKRLSCYGENIIGEVSEITKKEARKILMTEVDLVLDVLFKKDCTEIEI